jgi:NAD(P)-dependent dehydrogenase (short-subunit alcohol dehydrogenase family)
MRDKTASAIVTGGGQGIGKAIAKQLAEDGYHVVIADISGTRAKAVAEEIVSVGGKALAIKCDVSDVEQVRSMVEQATNRFESIDVLVNNAAYASYGPFLEFDPATFMRVIQVCLGGYFFCAQAAARQMAKRSGGIIVNIASAAAHVGSVDSSAYAAAKGGVLSLTRTLAVELAPMGIRVNGISPGVIGTEAVTKVLGEKRTNERLSRIPMQRFGLPEEIARAVRFLASEDSTYITGHTINVDGGWTVAGIIQSAN